MFYFSWLDRGDSEVDKLHLIHTEKMLIAITLYSLSTRLYNAMVTRILFWVENQMQFLYSVLRIFWLSALTEQSQVSKDLPDISERFRTIRSESIGMYPKLPVHHVYV